jgi:hypothetical protein
MLYSIDDLIQNMVLGYPNFKKPLKNGGKHIFQGPGLTLFQPVLGPNTFLRLSVNIPYVVWLVVLTPLKNISPSVGIIIPKKRKNKSHAPNHQPVVG